MKVKMKNKDSFAARLQKDIKVNWILYIMCIPVVTYLIVFKYQPMYGILMAFKDYKIKLGILDSPWNNFEYFKRFFSSYQLPILIKNTLTLSLYTLLVGFPIPIVFALFLNYLKHPRLKKVVQMVSYAPHFISTVVICGVITIFCNPKTGVFNMLLNLVGVESINFLSEPELFKHIYVWSGVWSSMGWSAIIYVSALAGVSPELHEAAIIDGATKLQRMRYIDLPSIKSTVVMLLIMRFGNIMSVGFEKVYLLQNDLNYSASAIISTYTYQVGLIQGEYGYSTAVSLFNNVIEILLLLSANTFCKKVMDESLL